MQKPFFPFLDMKIKFGFIAASAAFAFALNLSAAETPRVTLAADLAHPQVAANKKTTTYLKVGLTGFDMEPAAKRAPVNIAVVIDKSGSMAGDKIAHAKEAAKQALDRLGAGDTVSVVTYDDSVQVIAPASGLDNREGIKSALDKVVASGSTALFAGVSKGSEELRKNKKPNLVSRVILLSDGIANIGPSSPDDLGRLGTALAKEGMSVSTLGLGLQYNEDLMTQLALRSDGNHAFVQRSEELAQVFQGEFGDVLSVVAQALTIRIQCAEGVRPVRVLDREADVRGQEVTLRMNQLYAKQHKYVLLEVELPAGAADSDVAVADISVSYANAASGQEDVLKSKSVARRTSQEQIILAAMNKGVLIDVAKSGAVEREALAVKLNDEGKKEEAIKALTENVQTVTVQNSSLASPELEKIGKDQMLRIELFKNGGDDANRARKMSRAFSNANATQNISREPSQEGTWQFNVPQNQFQPAKNGTNPPNYGLNPPPK